MTQSVPSTFSPSSLRITRSTPWVDGCCGPILSTSSVESRNVASGILMSLAALDTEVLLNPTVVLLKNAVTLAQRVPLPLLGHEDAAHIRMAFELDAEHVEDLALQPVGRQVYAHGGLRLEAFGNISLDPHPLVPREAVDHVDHVKALGPLGPIHRGNVHQVIEVGFEFQILQQGNRRVRFGDDESLAHVGGSFRHTVAEAFPDFVGEVAGPGSGRHGGRRLRRRGGGWRLGRWSRWFSGFG